MRQRFVVLCLLVLSAVVMCWAAKPNQGFAGRWEGEVQIPGAPMVIVVDLAQKDGAWVGSAIIPGYGVKGSPITDVVAKGADLDFAMKKALGGATFKAHMDGDALAGEFIQGGNKAPLRLRRTGEAQVEFPKTSMPVTKEFEGEWRGSYQFVTTKLNVALKLKAADPTKPGELVVVDWGNATFPVEWWAVDGSKVSFFVADAGGITYEGEFNKETSEFVGTVRHSIVEQPLTLKRLAAN